MNNYYIMQQRKIRWFELTHSYVKDNNYTTKYSADKESNFLGQQS
jgi:hypothetical protein